MTEQEPSPVGIEDYSEQCRRAANELSKMLSEHVSIDESPESQIDN